MVKIRLVSILLLSAICIAIPAGATIDSTNSSVSLSSLTVTPAETLIVKSGHTLTVDVANSVSSPLLSMIFVRSGGTLAFATGSGLMCNSVVLGNRGSAPFVSSNGGTLTMAATSYLYLRHHSSITYDFEVGPSATVSISVNVTNPLNAAVIASDVPSTYGSARMYIGNTSASVTLSGIRFRQMYRGFATGGIEFNATGRLATTTTIDKCWFDTSNVCFTGVYGHKLNRCYFQNPETVAQSVFFQSGQKDTLSNSTIYINTNGFLSTAKGVYIYNQDSTVVSGTRVEEIGVTGFTNSYATLIDGASAYAKFTSDTMIGFGFVLFSNSGTANPGVMIDNCYLRTTNGHACIAVFDGDSNWTIQGSTILKMGSGGRSPITCYPATTAPNRLKLYYNTIWGCTSSPASSAIAFEHTAAGNVVYTNIEMVGNLLIGDNTGFNRAEIILGTTSAQTVTVSFSQFKYNAFDSVYSYGSSSINYPYSRSDSNKDNATSFLFADSLNQDFRLSATSPMLNCGDSTYAVGVFGSAQASKAPFDIGYYQSYTTGTCGGAPPTPTGACCYNTSTCAIMTQAQCTTLGGTYEGDGTTTCSNCTSTPGGGTANRSWVQTATITYQSTITDVSGSEANSATLYRQLGWYDMLLGGGGRIVDSFIKYNPTGTVAQYTLTSTTYPSVSGAGPAYNDSTWIKQWCDSAGVDMHTILMTPSSPVTIQMTTPYAGDQPVSTAAGDFLRVWDYNTYRNMIDLRSPYAWHILWRKLTRNGYAAPYNMFMEDEGQGVFGGQGSISGPYFPFPATDFVAGGYSAFGWPSGWTERQIADSIYNILMYNIYPKLDDSLEKYNLTYFKNYAAYFYMTDSTHFHEPFNNPSQYDARFAPNDIEGQTYIGNRRINLLLGEGSYTNCTNWARQWQYLTYMQQQVDSGDRVIFWTGPYFYYNGKQTNANGTDDITTFGKERAFRERYCYYLMAQHPTLTWWLYSSNGFDASLKAADSIMQRGIVNYNIGQPVSSFTNLSTAQYPRVYPRLKRVYTNAVVLWNFKNAGAYTYDLSADTALYHCTSFREVTDSGTLSSTGVLTVNLLDGDGRIMVPNTSSIGGISVGDASVTEGGNLIFTVSLTQTQSVVSSFNYTTSNGTATSGTDYTATSGSKSIGIGDISTTITVPTTNRGGCQNPATRSLVVTISSVLPSSLIVIDPTGTGTITDDDCGTTYGKTYKGKIVIKGKVKP